VIAGGGLNTEDYLALRAFCGRVLDTAYYHCGDELFGPQGPDESAVAVLGSRFAELSDVLAASTVLSLGCDLFDEAPSLGLRIDIAARRGRLALLSARGHGSDADRFASLFLNYGPGNLLRVVRGLTNALSGAGEVPPEVEELAQRLRSVGEDCAILVGQELWRSEDPRELLHALEALRGVIETSNPETERAYLNPVYPAVNSVGALLANDPELLGGSSSNGTRPPAGSLHAVLEAAADGKLKALLIVDSDVLTCYPDRSLVERALSAVEHVIYCGPFATPTSEAAQLHLPLGTWAHYDGTVLSMEWRMQKRNRASIDSVAPSLLDVLNSIAAAMDCDHVASDADELLADLARAVPGVPRVSLETVPDEGVLLRLEGLPGGSVTGVSSLPAAVTGTAEFPLVVAPKRFLYNDRQELRYSRVFDQVARPFFAYVHPDDLERLGLADGDDVALQGDSGRELTLTVRPARWVGPGSIVINDYNVKQPANQLAGAAPVRVALNKLAGVRED
jgi:predicted molibdopterin-dependent oxidoreductase YjgC